MGLSAGQTSHNSLQKSALNINGKISTKTALSCHPRPAPLANQPWPTRSDQRGQGVRPAHLLPTTACASHPKNSQPARPAHDHGPSASTTTLSAGRRFRIRSAMQAAVSSSQTTDVVVRKIAQRRNCQRWSHAVRQHQCRAAWAPPGLHSKHAHSALDLRHVTNQPTHASGPTSCSSSSSAWSRRSRVQNGLRIVAGVFATFANSVSHTFAVDRMTPAPPKPVSHGVWAAVHA